MPPTRVHNEEALYRAVRASSLGGDEYVWDQGTFRITQSAFNDRYQAPSVDRSSLRVDPAGVKKSPTDGVVQLITAQVRQIGPIRVNPSIASDSSVYSVDAVHRPIDASSDNPTGNPAHCRIECTPTITPNHFNKRLREALARIATENGWVIPPS